MQAKMILIGLIATMFVATALGINTTVSTLIHKQMPKATPISRAIMVPTPTKAVSCD